MASIRKRGKGYQVTVSNGRKPDGTQIVETATFIPDPDKTEKQNQKALEVFAMKFEDQVKSGTYLDGEKITFDEFSKRYLEEYAVQHLDPNTLSQYKTMLRLHIIPAIGQLKMSKVQPVNLNRLYNQLLVERKDGKEGGYSIKTIKHVNTAISAIFTLAVKWNVVNDNPCRRVTPPTCRKEKKIKYFTLEQAEAFLKALDSVFEVRINGHTRVDDTGKSYTVSDYTERRKIPTQYRVFFNLALFCGARRGELIALQWSDFDFTRNTLSITKSTSQINGKAVTKETKTESSNRIISVPASVMEMVKAYRKEYLQLKLRLGDAWEGDNFVFIQWNGLQMHPSTPYGEFKKIIRWYNDSVEKEDEKLPDIPLHGLRHTSATLLISQNVDVRTVGGRLGHAQTSTTMNIYSHFLKRADEAASDALENLLSVKPKSTENESEKTLVKC